MKGTPAGRASRGARIVRAMLCLVLLGLPVFALAVAVRRGFEPMQRLDEAAIAAATGFTRSSGLASALIVGQAVSHPTVVYIAATLVALWAGIVKGLRTRAIWAFCTMMATWVLGELLKLIVHRGRPTLEQPLSLPTGYSFPSGHALNITVATGVLLILLWPLLPAVGRVVAVALGVVVVLAVGLNRVLLGVHFPSDVVAGYVLGCCITFSSWIGFAGPMDGTSWSGSSPQPSSSAP